MSGASIRRVNISRILSDPVLREELFVGVIIATQAREGVVTTRDQAIQAYRKVRHENLGRRR